MTDIVDQGDTILTWTPMGMAAVGLTATGLSCSSCGTVLPPNSKFCNECGAPLTQATRSAEYKQVTVLFADVVHSMDIAAAVGAERLREIMSELVGRSAALVRRYGGTMSSSPATASWRCSVRQQRWRTTRLAACLAALGIQEEAKRLASDVQERDGVELQREVAAASTGVLIHQRLRRPAWYGEASALATMPYVLANIVRVWRG